MNPERAYEDSTFDRDTVLSDVQPQDDFVQEHMWNSCAYPMSNESHPVHQFSERLANSITGNPLPNDEFQLANLLLFNGDTLQMNVDSGNGYSPNNLCTNRNFHSNQPNNNFYRFGTSSVRTPSCNVGLQNLQSQLPRGTNSHINIDLRNGTEPNNSSEGHNFFYNQPNNNFEPSNSSPMIGTSSNAAHQNNDPQRLVDTLHSNAGSDQCYHGNNRRRGTQESVTGLGINSSTCSPSSIAKDANRALRNNSKVNPVSISHPRKAQSRQCSPITNWVDDEAPPSQELRKRLEFVKNLWKPGGNPEDIRKEAANYADFMADDYRENEKEQLPSNSKPEKESGKDPKSEKKKRNKVINANMSQIRRQAKGVFYCYTAQSSIGRVQDLTRENKTLVQDNRILKQENEALLKRIEELTSRSNPTGLSEEPPSDDPNGGNSGGDSTGRSPGDPSSRNTQGGGLNGMTFGNSQPSRDGSASDNLPATAASRMSVGKLLTSSSDGNCVKNSRDNVQPSLEKLNQDFMSEERSDDDECDNHGESSDEGSNDSTEMNYGKGNHCSERDNNERVACSTRNDNERTSYTEKKDNWRGDCTEEIDSTLLGAMKMNERETSDASNHTSQMNNGEYGDCATKKGNARARCIEMNEIGLGESENNTNKQHLNSTPSLEPLPAIPPTPGLPTNRCTDDVPVLELPTEKNNGECGDSAMKKVNERAGCIEVKDIGQGVGKNTTNKPDLYSTPSSKPFPATPLTPSFLSVQGILDVPRMLLPPSVPVDHNLSQSQNVAVCTS